MERIAAQDARRNLSTLMGRVAFGNEIAVITKTGGDFIAMISMDDLRRYQDLEDFIDNLMADKALNEKGTVPWPKIKADHGL